jgi:succinyl-CoA:acetate CoA-transferase
VNIENRIFNNSLKRVVMSADEASRFIENGMTVACSGFTACGYPKAVPLALAGRIHDGEQIRINLITGASVGEELDEALASLDGIARRYPYQTGPVIQRAVNEGRIMYQDIHLSRLADQIRCGYLGHIDVAVIEAAAIREDGGVIPTTSVGNSATFVREADRIIVEINTTQPMELEGMHDIYIPEPFGRRCPIPITEASQRAGTTAIPCDLRKITAVCPCDIKDGTRLLLPADHISSAIGDHLIDFIDRHIRGKLCDDLPPFQSGVGTLANIVMRRMAESDWEEITLWAEVIQDAIFDLIDEGKLCAASGTSLTPSPEGLERFYRGIERYREKIILRPLEVSNSAEVVSRLGIVAMNTAVEADIYGNVNSSHVGGGDVVNGIGGSGDFSRNALLSVFMTPSTARGGKISRIVPQVTHVDHTEHEVHVIVTEQGLADLRGLDPRERAVSIIENCAHPRYRDVLRDYYRRAARKGGHEPVLLDEAFAWHLNFEKTGDMLTE